MTSNRRHQPKLYLRAFHRNARGAVTDVGIESLGWPPLVVIAIALIVAAVLIARVLR